MATPTPSIKRHNHRIHPCDGTQKVGLLKHLVTQNKGKDILIVTADDPAAIEGITQDEHILIKSDKELSASVELSCDLLISLDLPDEAADYMARLTRTKNHAVILLSKEEQTALYPIEMLLGRNIMQEIITGFEPASMTPSKAKGPKQRAGSKEQRARNSDQHTVKRPNDKSKDDNRHPARRPNTSDAKKTKSRVKKSSGVSRYIGKDENGKPMFSGKTGERNHRYDGKPKEALDRQDKPKSKSVRTDNKSADRRTDKNRKREDARDNSTFKPSKSYDTKEAKKSYDRTSTPGSKPSGSAKPSSQKRAPRTFRVQADKGSRGSK